MRLGKSSIVYPFPNKETREKLGTGWEVFDQECFFYVEAWVSSRFLSLQNEIPILSDPEVLAF